MNERMNAIRDMAKDYLNATPEQQAKAKTAMQQLMNEYYTLGGQVNEAFGRMNAANENYNNAYTAFNTPAVQPTVRRRITPNTNNQGINETENDLWRLNYYTNTLWATVWTGWVLYNSKWDMYTSNGYAVDWKTWAFVNIPTNTNNNNNNTYSINRYWLHQPTQSMRWWIINTPVYTPSPFVKAVNDKFNRKFHLHWY